MSCGTAVIYFDVLDRLVTWSTPAASGSYAYDAIGNRTSEIDGATTKNHTYAGTSNRLTSQNGVAITHLASGQRLNDGAPQRSFTYNARGRLATVSQSGATLATYQHDALEQRAQKTAAGVSTLYVYDIAGHMIGEYRPDGSVVREYAYLDDEPVAQFEASGQIEYLHPDHLGTPRQATDGFRAVVWRWEGEPFGDVDPNENPDGDATQVKVNLRFPGQYFDSETRLVENWHRYYDPAMGRYVESDPIGIAGGTDGYTYVENEPMNWSDPKGTFRIHGNWCGPNWTGGRRESYSTSHDSKYAAPGDGLDNSCRTHDICYAQCRQENQCDSGTRGRCFEMCESDLRYATRRYRGAPARAVEWAMGRPGERFEPNPSACPSPRPRWWEGRTQVESNGNPWGGAGARSCDA